MDWLTLPEPQQNITPAFTDATSARAWLAAQPLSQPIEMINLIGQQVDGVAGSAYPAPQALELLDILRSAAAPLLIASEARFTRKALPLGEEEQRAFTTSQRFWRALGVAYFRLLPLLAPDDKLIPLHRAATAFRLAQYCHFLAAQSCPPQLDRLLFGVLEQAGRYQLLDQSSKDADFSHFGDATLAGHLAWAFLVRLIDPYHLSAAQLTVANRAISRWRELAGFQVVPDDDPKAHSVDLQPIFGGSFPENMPRWLEVRKVERKISNRIDSLRAGEAPDALKLGRELSATACIRLLQDMESHLEVHLHQPSTEVGELELAFGGIHAYALFTGKPLIPTSELDVGGSTLSHQRVALFGFDRVSAMPTSVKKLSVPSETWVLLDGRIVRPPGGNGTRKVAPCLIATTRNGIPRLGQLTGLQSGSDGALSGELRWFEEQIEVCRLKIAPNTRYQGATPIFLLRDGDQLMVLMPPTPNVFSGVVIALEETAIERLRLGEVIERGTDFVICAATLA